MFSDKIMKHLRETADELNIESIKALALVKISEEMGEVRRLLDDLKRIMVYKR